MSVSYFSTVEYFSPMAFNASSSGHRMTLESCYCIQCHTEHAIVYVLCSVSYSCIQITFVTWQCQFVSVIDHETCVCWTSEMLQLCMY